MQNLSGQIDTTKQNYSNISENDLVDSLKNSEDSMKVFRLQEVILFNRPDLSDVNERRKYYLTKRRIIKVYPYALLAAESLAKLDDRLEKINSPRQKKKYISIISSYIKNEYEATLKKFTTSEGEILLKLYYRQTGRTTYETIIKYKSGWKAFWFNVAANIYSLSLKTVYNPFKYKDDLMIEYILKELFDARILKEVDPFWESFPLDHPYFDPVENK